MGPVSALLKLRGRFLTRYLRVMVSLARPRDLVFVPELIRHPEGEKVLVLSPHCDDDVIGLGGLMHFHARAGHAVTVVYMTTPASGDKGGSNRGEVRKQEARKATELLGGFNLVFLDQPEGTRSPGGGLIRRFGRILQDTRPDVVCLPWFLDNHVDHLAANDLLVHASSCCQPGCLVYAYEVWTPLMPNRLLDITEVAGIKRKALAAYGSQLSDVDLVRTTLGLNQYRSMTHLKGAGYAEAFLRMNLSDYVHRVTAGRRHSILPGALETRCAV